MASKAVLALFLLFTTCLARQQQQQQQWQQNQCQIQNIEALEPYDIVEAEAGVTEIWDSNNQQFQCAGVDFIRHRIQPGGLLLPSYVNTPILAFIERGQGIHGVILPGCPETYEYLPQGEQRGQQQQQLQDRHQKVENLNEGDVVAIPTGAAHWVHNDGDSELVIVVFFDTQNIENQLDENHRRFFLAGNTQDQSQQQPRRQEQGQSQQQQSRREGQGQGQSQQQPRREGQEQGQSQQQPRRQDQGQGQSQQQPRRQDQGQGQSQQQPRRQGQGQGQSRREQPYQQNSRNIFSSMDLEFIAQAFNVNQEIAEKLQGQRDQRGHIVNVERGSLQIIRPQQTRQQPDSRRPSGSDRRRESGGKNGFEETICSLKLKENIDDPSHADFVNPQAGRIANLNSFKFPVLELLQLSIQRGQLERNAIQSPHWTFNAHSLIYLTEGSMRVQIVNNQGNSVFDDELREGQVVVVPQNFAVIKKAGEQGSRWVSFKTNDNAMIANLAGRVSAISSMPVDVVANSYQLSLDDAQSLKFSQRETVLFTPSQERRASA